MEIEAKGMISEAAKMKKDAERMFPGVSRNDGSLDSAPASTVEPKAKARFFNNATVTDFLCFFNLRNCWASISNWEEELWVFITTSRLMTPIHD